MTFGLDKSTWPRVAFGDVVRNAKETRKDDGSAPLHRVIAMEHMDPGELQIERWGDEADGTTFTRRVRPGQTLFGKRRAYQRKVAYAEFDAICSGDIYTFEAETAHMLGDFLPFLVQSDAFFDHALDTSAGSLSPRTKWSDLANFEFELPPLETQRRIADTMWAIENHRSALVQQARGVRKALDALTQSRLSGFPEVKRLGDIATTRSGPSFAASDVHLGPVQGAAPVLGIPNTKPDGTIDLAQVGYVANLPGSVGRIDETSLVLIRTNGNRTRIGNVYLPPVEAYDHVVSAFQFLMKAKEPTDRDFIYCVLVEPEMQKRMSDAASGSVGLGNLAVRWLNELTIPWSTNPEDRMALVNQVQRLRNAIESIEHEVDALVRSRSRMRAAVFESN